MQPDVHPVDQDTSSIEAMKKAIRLLFRSEEDVDESLEWGEPLNLVRSVTSTPEPTNRNIYITPSTTPIEDAQELRSMSVHLDILCDFILTSICAWQLPRPVLPVDCMGDFKYITRSCPSVPAIGSEFAGYETLLSRAARNNTAPR